MLRIEQTHDQTNLLQRYAINGKHPVSEEFCLHNRLDER
jgi:hypothetical protein